LRFSPWDDTENDKKQGDTVNKFAEWIKNSEKKQSGVAQKLSISPSTLHDILRKGQIPSLKLAYEIEKYTKGAITVYDWVDQPMQENKAIAKIIAKPSAKKIRK
jgi:DNA-binding XRE family transcriptional regulator